MNILIFTPEGGLSSTSAGIFNYNFFKSLAEKHSVDLLGFSLGEDYLFHTDKKIQKIETYFSINSNVIRKRYPRKNNINVANTIKSKSLESRIKQFIKPEGIDYFLLGLVDLIKYKRAYSKKYDVIISLSDPKSSHILSYFLVSKLKKTNPDIKWVQVWGDPWFYDITKKNSGLIKFIERKVLKRSDLIFYRSRPTLRLQKKEFPESQMKMKMLHRGFSGSYLENKTEKISKKYYNFIYAGDYHSNIRNISKFCRLLSKYGHTIKLIGSADAECKEKLQKLEAVSLLERIPFNELDSYVKLSDCYVALLNLSGSQIPGKLYDLIPVEKPVVLLVDGDIELEDIPCREKFILVKNNDKEIDYFFKNLTNLEAIKKPEFNKYHINNLVDDFVKEVNRILINKGFNKT